MKTLADFKRAMKIGTKWKASCHLGHTAYLGVRECKHVDSVKFGFLVTEGISAGHISFCDWPKASNFAVNDKGQVEIYCTSTYNVGSEQITERKLVLTYEKF
jgi:hypothetical protein